MTGLDPVIHAAPPAPKPEVCAYGTPWMTGSSPAMTILIWWSRLRLPRPYSILKMRPVQSRYRTRDFAFLVGWLYKAAPSAISEMSPL